MNRREHAALGFGVGGVERILRRIRSEFGAGGARRAVVRGVSSPAVSIVSGMDAVVKRFVKRGFVEGGFVKRGRSF